MDDIVHYFYRLGPVITPNRTISEQTEMTDPFPFFFKNAVNGAAISPAP